MISATGGTFAHSPLLNNNRALTLPFEVSEDGSQDRCNECSCPVRCDNVLWVRLFPSRSGGCLFSGVELTPSVYGPVTVLVTFVSLVRPPIVGVGTSMPSTVPVVKAPKDCVCPFVTTVTTLSPSLNVCRLSPRLA